MEFNLYQPHENQIKIHEHPAKNRVVVAGRRFGKSALGLNEGLATAFQVDNQIIWIILPLFRQAKEIYWIDPDVTKYFMPFVQEGLIKMDKSELSLNVLSTNSWIRLKGSDNYDSLRGSGLDLIIWDEAADIKPEAFETIKPALADSPDHRQLFIGTPKGLNHFHDFALYGDHKNLIPTFNKPIKKRDDWYTWHFSSYDNFAFAPGTYERKQFVKYIDQQKVESEEKGRLGFFNQEYMASFEEGAGRFFPKWTYKSHVYEGRIIPKKDLFIFETMDWGRSSPFAWYASVLQKVEFFLHEEWISFNRIFTFAELYGTEKSPAQWADEIVKKRHQYKYKKPDAIYVDPSMNNRLSDGSMSISRQMNQRFDLLEEPIVEMVGGTRDRPARWAAMDNWMLEAPDGIPYWIITTDNPNLIRTIPEMTPDDHDMNDLDTTLEDHGVDSISYGLPFMKWIDAKVGTIKRKSAIVNQTPKHIGLLSPDMFK